LFIVSRLKDGGAPFQGSGLNAISMPEEFSYESAEVRSVWLRKKWKERDSLLFKGQRPGENGGKSRNSQIRFLCNRNSLFRFGRDFDTGHSCDDEWRNTWCLESGKGLKDSVFFDEERANRSRNGKRRERVPPPAPVCGIDSSEFALRREDNSAALLSSNWYPAGFRPNDFSIICITRSRVNIQIWSQEVEGPSWKRVFRDLRIFFSVGPNPFSLTHRSYFPIVPAWKRTSGPMPCSRRKRSLRPQEVPSRHEWDRPVGRASVNACLGYRRFLCHGRWMVISL